MSEAASKEYGDLAVLVLFLTGCAAVGLFIGGVSWGIGHHDAREEITSTLGKDLCVEEHGEGKYEVDFERGRVVCRRDSAEAEGKHTILKFKEGGV